MIAMKTNGNRLNCLNHTDLIRVLNGEFPPQEFDSAIEHLEQCDDCRRTAESIQSDDVAGLPDPPTDELQNETACQAAMLKMLQTPVEQFSDESRVPSTGGDVTSLGPYRILGPLGGGGMSTVLLGEHERLRRRCAIKLLPRERVDHPGWLDRFEREMVAVAALQHPHIVSATDAGHQDGWHYLVMEYLDGLDVGCLARRTGPLFVADACEIVRQAALGLDAIHSAGLVHRDIKPSNLMLIRSGVVKVLDLGLVLDGDDPISVDDRLTTVGHLMGTVAFMSPEQLADSRDVDARADVYSLGATLFRLIAGRTPHERQGGLTKQILAITQTDAPRLDTIRDEVPAEVVELVDRMLARDPERRPATAGEIAEQLETPATGHRLKTLVRAASRTSEESSLAWGTQSPLAAAANSNRKTPPPRRWPIWIAGGLLAALVLAAIVFKIQTDRGELIVHSELDGLTLVVTQDDEVVERLQITSDADNRTVLRKGKYRVAIEGGGEALKLSEEVVTIGRGTRSEVEIQPEATINNLTGLPPTMDDQELYQGHDFDHWIRIVRFEHDLPMVCRAIVAVQTLAKSREQQIDAATATLLIARRWGGGKADQRATLEKIGPNTEPSEVFMKFLLDHFPLYPTDVAVNVIADEIAEANERSLTAISYLMALHYFGGNFGDTASPSLIGTWLDQDDAQSESEKKKLLKQIQRTSLENAPKEMENLGMTYYVIVGIQEQLGEPVLGDPLVEPFLVKILASDAPWPDPRIVEIGIELAENDREGVSWDDVIRRLFELTSASQNQRVGELFDRIEVQEPDVLLKWITQRLNKFIPAKTAVTENATSRPNFRRAASELSVNLTSDLANPDIILWQQALLFYATHCEPTQESLNLLSRVRAQMQNEKIHLTDRLFSSRVKTDVRETKVFQPINAAIEQLFARYIESNGKPPVGLPSTTENQSDSKAPAPKADVKPEPAASNPPSTLLYQGQPYEHWMATLENERDVKRVSDAMLAIEILSRDTGARPAAAEATLKLARRWGSTVTTGESETQSEQGRANVYMRSLSNLLPAYLPSPGLRAMDGELEKGNVKSRLVVVGQLNRFRTGTGERNARTRQRKEAIVGIERLSETEDGAKLIRSIIEHLQPIAAGDGVPDDPSTSGISETAVTIGLWLTLAVDSELAADTWIAEAVRQRIDERAEKWAIVVEGVDRDLNAENVWRQHPDSYGYDPGGKNVENRWGLSEDELLAAVQLRKQDESLARYDEYFCDAMMDKWFERISHRSDEAFEFLSNTATDLLVDSTALELESMRIPIAGAWSTLRSRTRSDFETTDSLLVDPDSMWSLALPFFAEQVSPNSEALDLLGLIKERLKRRTPDPTESLQPLRSAIERIENRL